MKKVAIGCAVIGLVVLAIGIVAGVFGVRWIKGQMAQQQRYERVAAEMEKTWGTPEDFQPPADGVYDPERVGRYVAIRTRVYDGSVEFRDRVNDVATGRTGGWVKGFSTMLKILNEGMGHLATADSLMLDADMSRGEYLHYDLLAQSGFLDLDPSAFLESHPIEDQEKFVDAFEDFSRQYHERGRKFLRSQARNAQSAATEAGPGCAPCAAWSDYLSGQLERARHSRRDFPMGDPLPASLTAAFEPYRIELETSQPQDFGSWMLAMLMTLDINSDDGGFQIKIDGK